MATAYNILHLDHCTTRHTSGTPPYSMAPTCCLNKLDTCGGHLLLTTTWAFGPPQHTLPHFGHSQTYTRGLLLCHYKHLSTGATWTLLCSYGDTYFGHSLSTRDHTGGPVTYLQPYLHTITRYCLPTFTILCGHIPDNTMALGFHQTFC